MQLTEHFSLNELTASSKAKELGVDNIPNDIEIGHLKLLCTYLLEPLRQSWGSGIKVTSGFRSEALNNAIGGSKTSAHSLGYAADIVPTNSNRMAEFKKFVKEFLANYNWKSGSSMTFPFDQCIDERNAQGSEWIHLGLMNAKGEQRFQFLKTTDGKTYKQDKV